MNKKIIVITGPTATGKTALTIELAKLINAEIICADSRIIYKGLDIVSAKPSIKQMQGIKHHLIDIIEPDIKFSAGDFVKYSQNIIDELFKNNKNVIISGGTWFYIKSLLDEKQLPDCPINQSLRYDLQKMENIDLWKILNNKDPKRAKLIHPNNKDKIIRSIEMCEYLKMPISDYKRKDNIKYKSQWYMLDCTREMIYENINKRVDIMFADGLYNEWKKMSSLFPNCEILFNTIGYAEFFDFKKGLYGDLEEVLEKIKQHTRNFAKRQLTYFNSNKNIKKIANINDILKDFEK